VSGPDAYALDDRAIHRAFGAAAGEYERFSALQQEVGERLLEHLEPLRVTARAVLDLGAGPGRHSRALEKRFRGARLLVVDYAEPMLRVARRRRPWISRQRPVCADARCLPFAGASLDVVFSNLMLQWLHPPEPAFAEVHRCLREEGLFAFSTFGPDTLGELRRAWQAVDEQVHVNAFLDMHDLGDALVRAGFQAPVVDVEHITLTYADAASALRELRGIGVRNVNRGRSAALTGRGRWRRFLEALEAQAIDGRVPLTYEVIYGHAWRPARGARPQDGSTVAGSPVHLYPRRR